MAKVTHFTQVPQPPPPPPETVILELSGEEALFLRNLVLTQTPTASSDLVVK